MLKYTQKNNYKKIKNSADKNSTKPQKSHIRLSHWQDAQRARRREDHGHVSGLPAGRRAANAGAGTDLLLRRRTDEGALDRADLAAGDRRVRRLR